MNFAPLIVHVLFSITIVTNAETDPTNRLVRQSNPTGGQSTSTSITSEQQLEVYCRQYCNSISNGLKYGVYRPLFRSCRCFTPLRALFTDIFEELVGFIGSVNELPLPPTNTVTPVLFR